MIEYIHISDLIFCSGVNCFACVFVFDNDSKPGIVADGPNFLAKYSPAISRNGFVIVHVYDPYPHLGLLRPFAIPLPDIGGIAAAFGVALDLKKSCVYKYV